MCGEPCLQNETNLSEFVCEQGSYCPTAAQQIKCPAGTYCIQRSVLPISCDYDHLLNTTPYLGKYTGDV